jgi:nicotinamidase-related amidase
MGMEAHICILQTALSLIDKGKDVFVIEDAIISRNILNKQNAISRLRQAGCIITNTESVVFEWVGSADHEAFKKVAPLIKDID